MIQFEKKGIQFCFRNFKWNGSNLIAEYKIIGVKENKKNDGFYYNSEYVQSKNAMKFSTVEIKGIGKVGGVSFPGDINITEILEKAKCEYEKAKKEKIAKLDEKYSADAILKISYNTYYGFFLGEYGECTTGKEIEEILKSKHIRDEVSSQISDFKTEIDWGDYTTTYYYQIKVSDFEKIVYNVKEKLENEKRKKAAVNAAKEKEIFDKAKETGEKQMLKKWCEECNDPNEECNLDIITIWAMPDGSTTKTRSHTW